MAGSACLPVVEGLQGLQALQAVLLAAASRVTWSAVATEEVAAKTLRVPMTRAPDLQDTPTNQELAASWQRALLAGARADKLAREVKRPNQTPAVVEFQGVSPVASHSPRSPACSSQSEPRSLGVASRCTPRRDAVVSPPLSVDRMLAGPALEREFTTSAMNIPSS